MNRVDSSITLQDFTADPSRVIGDPVEKNQPTLLTRDGKGVAVVQGLDSFEAQEKRFMRAVVQGLLDLERGDEMSLGEAKRRLGLK